MSHFFTVVLMRPGADVQSTVERMLAPFQENNMGDCPKQYLKYRAYPKGEHEGQWFESEDAAKVALAERFDPDEAYYENPNKKWDWWVIGGRYTGRMGTYDPEKDPHNYEPCIYCGGTGTRSDFDYSGPKGSLKLEGVTPKRHRRIPYLRDALRWAAKGGFLGIALVSLLAMVVLIKARYYQPVPAAALVFVACTLFFVAPFRRELLRHPAAKAGVTPPADAGKGAVSGPRPIADVGNISPVRELPDDFACFAIVTPEGEWIERGRMGWWACVSNEKDEDAWKHEIRAVLDKYSDCIAVGVDCHI